jgi:hypothetical protein
MKLYSEHTVWNGSGVNHWYLLNDQRNVMVGYRKCGDGPIVMFRTPLPFYEKGRKLKLEHDFGSMEKERVVVVAGSNGNKYTVNVDQQTCSCPAFSFRGTCKHLLVARN